MSGIKKEPIKLNLHLFNGAVILGDLHIEQDALEECKAIAVEVLKYATTVDVLIQVGDLCDKNKLNAQELNTLTEIVSMWKAAFKKVYILEGNHDKVDNNSSILMYLRFLGVDILDDDVIFDFAFGKLRCGHFFVDKSAGAFGHHRMTLEEFKRGTDYGILGHQHDFQNLDNGFYHIGSSRFVSFGEKKTDKQIMLFYNNDFYYHNIDNCIPMFDVYDINSLEHLPKNSKVRYIFKSFKQLKDETAIVDKYKETFFQFKKHLDFKTETVLPEIIAENKISSLQLINKWLESFSDDTVKKALEEEFKKEFK